MSIKSYTRVVNNSDTISELAEGADAIYNAVSSTLGPWGRTVIIEKFWNPPHVTKDGVTVANEITLRDQVPNLAVEILRQAAAKTASEAGDGTTSTIVMAHYLFLAGYSLCKILNIPPSMFKYRLEKAVDKTIELLYKSYSKQIKNEEDMFNIAMVASNGDEEISRNVAKAFNQIGEYGVVTVNQSSDYKTTINVTDAIRWDKSHPSPLLRNKDGSKTVVNEPAVLVTDLVINTQKDFLDVARLQMKINRPLVVICDDIVEAPLEALTFNVINNKMPLYILRTPYIAQAKTDAYVDLATITGATFISKYEGWNLEQTNERHLGSCDKVEIDALDTYLFGRHGDVDKIQERIQYYQTKIETEFEARPNYIQRLGQLTSGSAVINVGGTNEIDIREKIDRYDDTISAVRSAIKKGYTEGAGFTYKKLSSVLNEEDDVEALLIKALSKINEKIGENAGFEINSSNGAIDPCLVIENVIKNSVGAALLLITSGYSIIKHNLPGEE